MSKKSKPFYYEYTNAQGVSILLDSYEWARGMGLEDREVRKAQAGRKREVKKGLAETQPA